MEAAAAGQWKDVIEAELEVGAGPTGSTVEFPMAMTPNVVHRPWHRSGAPPIVQQAGEKRRRSTIMLWSLLATGWRPESGRG